MRTRLIVLGLLVGAAQYPHSQVPAPIFIGQQPGFAVGPMNFPHDAGQVRLLDGRFLIAGNDDFTRHAELFDVATLTFSPTGSLNVGRCYGCGQLTLASGKVLLAGGWTGCCGVRRDAELYDPDTGTFSLSAGLMTHGRLAPSLIQLPNGFVLVVGGHDGFSPLPSAELYNPATDQFTLTNPPAIPRLGHAVTLADGRVFWAGGETGTSSHTIEIYDPATGLFTLVGNMTTQRHSAAAVRLADGRVLMAGGVNNSGIPTASAEVFDPATNAVLSTGPLSIARSGAFAVALPDGRAIVGGGYATGGVPTAAVDIFDPVTGSFQPAQPLLEAKGSAAATLLEDGSVFVSGGTGAGGVRLRSAQFYYPSEPTGSPVATITYGTPLDESHINAFSPIPGTFVYEPTIGSILDVGEWNVVVTFHPADTGAYATAAVQAKVVVVPARAEIALSDLEHTFDGHPKQPTVNVTPAAATITVTYDGAETPPVSAGQYVVQALAGGNYSGAATGTLVIHPAPLTVSANDVTRVVGSSSPAFSASFSGFPAGQSVTNLLGALNFTTSATATSPPGNYPVLPGGLQSSNYNISFVEGTLTITNGICPLFDGTRPVRSGSTIPVKLALCDANGTNISNPNVQVMGTQLSLLTTAVTGEVQDAGQSNPDNQFRYSPDLPGYIFNLQTTGLATGTYELRLAVSGDPDTHAVYFQVR